MIDFVKLLEQSKNISIEELQKKIEETGSYQRQEDDTYWYPKQDINGNASAVIRFMPTPPGEKSPFVLIISHKFKGPSGKQYSERSRRTIGQPDPVSQYNSVLWNTGDKTLQDLVKARSQRKTRVVNVLVLKEPNAPENEGKIFRFRVNSQLWPKIEAAMKPKHEDIPAINPFSLLDDGADFYIEVKKRGEWPNWEDSSFGPRKALFNGDMAKMRSVLEGQKLHSLEELISEDKFRSYDELKARLESVLEEKLDMISEGGSASAAQKPVEQKQTEAKPVEQKREEVAQQPKQTETKPVEQKKPDPEPAADDTDDDLAYFRALAGGN